MKKYFYWILVLFVVILGVYLVIISADLSQSVSKIQFTVVDRPEIFGQKVFENLREQIKDSPLIFLGVTPNQVEDLELWKGFLAANQQSGFKYDLVIMENQLPFSDVLAPPVKLDIKNEQARLVAGIKNALAQHLRVAVVAPTIYSSLLLTQNPASLLKNEAGLTITSLSIAKYPVTLEQEAEFEPRCSIDKDDRVGTGPLGCMIRTKARKLYRKKIESGKYSGIMDQLSERDYLILFNRD